MAGINFEKYHGGKEVKRIIRHNDKAMRLNDNHKNKHIDKSLTGNNWQLYDGYNSTCDGYDIAIDKFDKVPGQNKRHDRVTCFGIEVPRPKDLPSENFHEWHQKVIKIIQGMYPDATIVNSYEHVDEVHEYRNAETGELTISREHGHTLIIPNDKDGRLNGKQFSCRKNINRLNNEIQAMTLNDYGCAFMDGSKKKSDKTVTELKNESRIKDLEQDLQDKIQGMTQEAFDDGFLAYLSSYKFKNGKTGKDFLKEQEKAYKKHLTATEEKPVEEDTKPVEPIEVKPITEPVKEPVKEYHRKTYEELFSEYIGGKPTSQDSPELF